MAGMPAWKSTCLPGNKKRLSEDDHIQNVAGEIPLYLQLGEYSARVCPNPRSVAGSVACDKNREMLR